MWNKIPCCQRKLWQRLRVSTPFPHESIDCSFMSALKKWVTWRNCACHFSECLLSPNWDCLGQCHWSRCVRRWAGNPNASDVNESGGESTQAGHGETLTFLILFLNLLLFHDKLLTLRHDEGFLTSTKFLWKSSIPWRLTTFSSAWG